MTAREVLASIAMAHAGCSARNAVQVYTDIIIRRSDRNPKAISYFLGYNGSPPSTCALTVLGCWILAGMKDDVLVKPYVPGAAMQDIQTVGAAHGALTRARAGDSFPLAQGDAWIIVDANGNDAHAGICTSDVTSQPDGSIQVATVEGGQGPDSSAIQQFMRTWRQVGGLWMAAARHLFVSVDASKLGIAPTP